MRYRTANTDTKARSDISADISFEEVFMDVHIFNPNAESYYYYTPA